MFDEQQYDGGDPETDVTAELIDGINRLLDEAVETENQNVYST